MHVTEAIRIALQSLWVNKLRSVLTLLGVVIGVAAVIAVVTFVSGVNDYVAQKVFNLGADVFIIFKVSPAVTNVDHFLEGEKRKDLTMEDYQAVADACRQCEYIGAVLRNETGHVKYAEQSISDTSVRGVTPSMAPIYDTDLSSGRMLNETDLNNRAPVAVVGTDIVDHLMAGTDPVGKEIRLDGWTYQIIGVGAKKGTTLGQSADNYVMIPITSFLKQYGAHNNSIRISGKLIAPEFRSMRQSTSPAPRCVPSAMTRQEATIVLTSKPMPACSASGPGSARHFSSRPSELLASLWWWAALSS